MTELDQAWARMLDQAIQNAETSGRGDVADYLSLKRSNDLVRETGVQWLFDSMIEIAAEASRTNPSITIEREEPHEFAFQNSTMAGGLLRVMFGVRRVTVEAGWTRTPAHGFMRNGALAAARITHFGMPKAGVDLVLVRNDGTPVWNQLEGGVFDSNRVREQFSIFLGV